jgi:hexokinase
MLLKNFKAVIDEEEMQLTERLLKEKGREEYFGDISDELKEWIEEREKFLAESMARAYEVWVRREVLP